MRTVLDIEGGLSDARRLCDLDLSHPTRAPIGLNGHHFSAWRGRIIHVSIAWLCMEFLRQGAEGDAPAECTSAAFPGEVFDPTSVYANWISCTPAG